jgi:predicted dehydrogenase
VTAITRLTIAGDTDLARDVYRYAIGNALAERVSVRLSPQEFETTDEVVISVAAGEDLPEFAAAAVAAGCRLATLPIADLPGELEAAAESGQLRQFSPHFGRPVVRRLLADARDGRVGRPYGLYVAHRLPRSSAGIFAGGVSGLVALALEVIDSPPVRVQATHASYDGSGESWLLLLRFDGDTIATLECSAVLPPGGPESGNLLVELTGSDAVLRAEPSRQAVRVTGAEGRQIARDWAPNPAGPLLQHALAVLERPAPLPQARIVDVLRAARESAGSGEPVSLMS